MAKQALRVQFTNAPAAILKQLFGEAKHSKIILDALTHFTGYAHEQEIFHYLNTDNDGDFVVNPDGSVSVSMVNLRKQLATMIATGQIKRHGGERSASYALLSYEGAAPEADEDEEGEDEADEADAA